MNGALLVVSAGAVVFAAVVWITPAAAMRLAGYLIARATALNAARQVYRTQFEELRPRPARRKRALPELPDITVGGTLPAPDGEFTYVPIDPAEVEAGVIYG